MKTALVTGAAGGLGRCTAEHLAERGFQVFASDLPSAIAGQASPPNVRWVAMDVTDAGSIERATKAVSEATTGLDAIVNFAGIMAVGSMIELPIETVQRIVDVNLFGTYRVNQAFFSLLRERKGRIVNISSETGWQSGAPFNGAYALSKHAIEAYTDSLRRELMLLDMHVIKVQPGAFKTNMVKSIDASFRRAIEGSTIFKGVLERVRTLAIREEAKANDPALLAATIYEALMTKSPKPVYSVRPDAGRSALEYMPSRWADGVLKKVLGDA
jgi:NAD(P)-dependent dehydrogenase (short-subunit alcohol dehydrogenase family)